MEQHLRNGAVLGKGLGAEGRLELGGGQKSLGRGGHTVWPEMTLGLSLCPHAILSSFHRRRPDRQSSCVAVWLRTHGRFIRDCLSARLQVHSSLCSNLSVPQLVSRLSFPSCHGIARPLKADGARVCRGAFLQVLLSRPPRHSAHHRSGKLGFLGTKPLPPGAREEAGPPWSWEVTWERQPQSSP